MNKNHWELGRWSFTAASAGLAIEGEITCPPAKLVAVTYEDPDGDKLWCNNSEVASIRLELHMPDNSSETITAQDTCAVEFADRRIYESVQPRI